MSTLDSIKAKIAEIKKQKEELTASLRKDFAPMLKPLFEKSQGKIKSIGWNQYTPYFNDGNECTFSVNLDYPIINGNDYYDINEIKESIGLIITEENKKECNDYAKQKGYSWMYNRNVGEYGYIENKNIDHDLIECIKEFKEILSSIDDEFYKDLFGDHVQVTVYENGNIEVEEYEHD